MELAQLERFIRVAELGSISRAASVLDIAQSALSRQIRELEKDLGAQLLHRNGRGVTLTSAGERFLQQVKRSLADLNQARDELSVEAKLPRGVVSIGLPASLSQIVSLPLILKARQNFPDVTLRLMEGFSGSIVDWLHDGRLDIGVTYLRRGEDVNSVDSQYRDVLCLAGSAALLKGVRDTAAMADLGRLPLALPASDQIIRQIVDEAATAARVALKPAIEVNSFIVIRDIVLSGLACAVLPLSVAAKDAAEGRLRVLSFAKPSLHRTLAIRLSPRGPMTLAQKVVAKAVREIVQQAVRRA